MVLASCRSRFALFAALLAALLLASAGEEEPSGEVGDDSWSRLTTDDWQPGRVGKFNTTFPIKDMECLGPETAIRFNAGLDWATVKAALHLSLGQLATDTWLFQVVAKIQRDEPDTCVLGITTTSSFLLPVTMPKFRNMARMLNTDHNLLVLNVTFYDSLRSGFPVFGVLDSLATPEFRAWFATEEGLSFFSEPAHHQGVREPRCFSASRSRGQRAHVG
mmetsp:Transcript_18095/g.58581  ORF Transcript_18095/g.58581 Transcript_18095/m.58581 type:complete len:219 (-) Transcript_18095:457-1113(-)